MANEPGKIAELLRSLIPKDPEDFSILGFILRCAQWLHRGSHLDLGIGMLAGNLAAIPPGIALPIEVQEFLHSLPEESKRYLHGLSDALDLYYSISHRSLPVQALSQSEASLHEIKQIRDMCMEDGFRAIY